MNCKHCNGSGYTEPDIPTDVSDRCDHCNPEPEANLILIGMALLAIAIMVLFCSK